MGQLPVRKEAPSLDPRVREIQDLSTGTNSRSSQRTSLEPPETFLGDQHIGPTAGVSFLYHSWSKNPEVEENAGHTVPAPLKSHGDFPQSSKVQLRGVDSSFCLPTVEKTDSLLERYFRFATPTYRFLHRPTLEGWAFQLLAGNRLSVAKSACVLLACAQSLLYTTPGERYANGGDEDLNMSRLYYEQAKTMLENELGPASLASVQSRLAMCLYLLSTFKINESRFCFSFASEILTSVGLHRKTPKSQNMDLVELESRKRTFWCAYVLDGYLSVMLGRPRILRDEDTDQPYPRNLDDLDMLSSESPEDLPLHGNLEAFVWHIELAKLMGHNNDLLYPLKELREEEVIIHTVQMIEALDRWRDGLPDFLKSREKTLAGQRTFERQNTVLKLAQAHLRVLATRKCLLTDFSKFGRTASPHRWDTRALEPVQECIAGIGTIIGTAYDLMQSGSLYQAFWFTQYTALVAISTLYVFLIQGARNGLPAPTDTFPDIEIHFDKAKQCQRHLADIAPEGSQARRHHKLLDHLRLRAEKDLVKTRRHDRPWRRVTDPIASQKQCSPSQSSLQQNPQLESSLTYSNSTGSSTTNPRITTAPYDEELIRVVRPCFESTDSSHKMSAATYTEVRPDIDGSDGNSFTTVQFTPTEDDFDFQYMLDFGWESLDTIGKKYPIIALQLDETFADGRTGSATNCSAD